MFSHKFPLDGDAGTLLPTETVVFSPPPLTPAELALARKSEFETLVKLFLARLIPPLVSPSYNRRVLESWSKKTSPRLPSFLFKKSESLGIIRMLFSIRAIDIYSLLSYIYFNLI